MLATWDAVRQTVVPYRRAHSCPVEFTEHYTCWIRDSSANYVSVQVIGDDIAAGILHWNPLDISMLMLTIVAGDNALSFLAYCNTSIPRFSKF
jgi:hypothetical protein